MAEFLHVITADQLVQLLGRFSRLPAERVPLDASLDRVLCEDIIAGEDLPEGARSTVDGYAVRAEDTFGASDSIPAFLDVVGSIAMGTLPDFEIRSGQAAQIPTGGFLPLGADAVVMVEYTNQAGAGSIEVTKPVTLRTNVLEKGEDAKSGEILLSKGKKLRSQELGFLAALGITEAAVYRKPRVAVISSGDEVVPIERKPGSGQIRDANGHAISALVRACGAEPFGMDIVPDNAGKLGAAIRSGLEQADVVVLSGGSSVGTRDLMVDAVSSVPGAEILAHGVAIRPGKPTLLADDAGKAIVGLPGHPVSALIVAQVFLAPFLLYIQGARMGKGPVGQRMKGALATSIHSTIGLEEYVRVRIEESASGETIAHPVFGKSGMISTMVKANGIVMIPLNAEGFSKGEVVQVIQY
ncbi:MAG TPA: gephyrin-like molybdotransferase Glp [Acidobacteriota bacterium]|nr:gephyrin-like molybdotransferase Glp [Acidobacteriota bacterium]